MYPLDGKDCLEYRLHVCCQCCNYEVMKIVREVGPILVLPGNEKLTLQHSHLIAVWSAGMSKTICS